MTTILIKPNIRPKRTYYSIIHILLFISCIKTSISKQNINNVSSQTNNPNTKSLNNIDKILDDIYNVKVNRIKNKVSKYSRQENKKDSLLDSIYGIKNTNTSNKLDLNDSKNVIYKFNYLYMNLVSFI